MTAYTRSQNIKDLARIYPELVPAAHFLPQWTQKSESVEEFSSTVDPLRSDLLALCELFSTGQEASEVQNTRIAAVAGGNSGDIVRLLRLNQVQYGWQDHDAVHFLSNTLQKGVESRWEGQHGPVQQLCFAGKLQPEHACWLAVRYHTTTIIIQLSTAPERTSLGLGPYIRPITHKLAAAAIYGSVIVTLPIKRTGGTPHADICFSPWSRRRFGILDQQGRWSIWTIHGHSQRRELPEAKILATGSIYENSDKTVNLSDSFHDGWGRMLWIDTPKTVLLAMRTCLTAFHIELPLKRLWTPEPALSGDGDWILDMKRSSLDLSHVFVLTTTRIFWLRTYIHEVPGTSNTDLFIKSLLSWKHFRDPADISLRISVLGNSDSRWIQCLLNNKRLTYR